MPTDPADQQPRPEAPPAAPLPLVERATGIIAIAGGALALLTAVLVTVSVLGRKLFDAPIEGDFEFVKMWTAIGVFAYLPYTQARRGHIIVDTFTQRLPARARDVIDAGWDLVFAAMMGICAAGLAVGTVQALHSGETTMQRQIPLWPAIAVAALLCGLLAATALATAVQLVRRGR